METKEQTTEMADPFEQHDTDPAPSTDPPPSYDGSKDPTLPAPPSPLELEVRQLRAELDQATRAFSGLTRRLGLDYCPLSTHTAEVRAQYRSRLHRIQELEQRRMLVTPELAEEWGADLMRVTPSYLALVREACTDPEPWKSYLRLVELGLLAAPEELLHSYRWAYGLLATGARTVLHAGYLLSRQLGLPPQGLPDPENDTHFDLHLLSMVSYLRDRL